MKITARQPHRGRHERSSEAGAALVEAALTLPLLLLVLFGAIDFGRVFYAASAASEAVQAGVHYGSRQTNRVDYIDPTSPEALTHYDQMEAAASNAASDISGFSAIASSFCTCSGAPDTTVTCDTACPIGDTLRYYVQVDGTYTFTSAVPYPGIPHTLVINRTARMQVMQ
jgi:Flp pilus assembly protein TadG